MRLARDRLELDRRALTKISGNVGIGHLTCF